MCSALFRGNVPVKSKLKHPPRVYPRHLTSFPARDGGNLMNLGPDYMNRAGLSLPGSRHVC